jgi:putative ABC transport system permease protein
MFQNYLAAALRNLLRNRLYAAINILGLAVGFAGALFAALFVRHELTYNHWIPGYERTYTIVTTAAMVRGAAPVEWTFGYRDAAAWLKLDFREVEAAGRMRGQGTMMVRRGDIRAAEDAISAADVDFFSAVPIPAVAGDPRTALDRPDAVVLTRYMARKYFERDAPIGEIILLDDHPMRVSAVIEDPPSNSAFPGGGLPQIYIPALASFSVLNQWDSQSFGPGTEPGVMIWGGSYVRLKPDASVETLKRAFPEFVTRRMPVGVLGEVKMRLLPIAALHPPSLDNPQFIALHNRFQAMIAGVAGIGMLIAAAATINFVNAATARASRRAVEVGIRKVTGAMRRQLMVQFVGEAVVHAIFAMIVAVGLVSVLLPGVRAILDRDIAFDFWREPLLIVAVGVIALVVGVLAGAYPAFVLASFRPAAMLKVRSGNAAGSKSVRQGLVTLQFAILIGVGVVAGVISHQAYYAIHDSPRFDKDEVVLIRNGCLASLKNEVEKLVGVRQAACGDIRNNIGYQTQVTGPDGIQHNGDLLFRPTDYEFFALFGLESAAGRLFSRDQGEDEVDAGSSRNPNIVINEAAARKLGFAAPIQAVGQNLTWRRIPIAGDAVSKLPALPSRIVGVMRDFSTNVTDPIAPSVYYVDAGMFLPTEKLPATTLNVKLTGADVPETLQAIDHLWNTLGAPARPIRRQFADQMLEEVYRDLIQQAEVVTALAGMALFIAALGLFGLSAFTAERRTKEMGVRKALGATRADILSLLMWEFARPVIVANFIAWPAAYLFARNWLDGFTDRVDLQPWLFFAASILALAIAAITVAGHALVLARAQPALALRYE